MCRRWTTSRSTSAGEIHGLLGENGAGKSTLLKILSGAELPDGGRIEIGGQRAVLTSPQDAQAQGIATIYQELNLLPNLSVAENVFIGREPGGAPFSAGGGWPRRRARSARGSA